MGDDASLAKESTLQSSSTQSTTHTTLSSALPSSRPVDATFTAPSSSSTPTELQQKVTIGQNGRRRIQPINISGSLTSQTFNVTDQRQKPSLSSLESHGSRPTGSRLSAIETIDYDSPSASIPQSGIGTAVLGNKRKAKEAEEDAMDVDGNETRILDAGASTGPRGKPIWVDSAVIPPVISHSKVQLGIPKVKSTLQRKLFNEENTIVMECHNAIATG